VRASELSTSQTFPLWTAMKRRGVNKQRLAELLGSGKSHVTQLLNGGRNMTLRTLSDVGEALSQQIEIVFVDKVDNEDWQPVCRSDTRPILQSVARPVGAVAANEEWTDAGELCA
jgi:transcriptional regulator with XRE-family HTH domain